MGKVYAQGFDIADYWQLSEDNLSSFVSGLLPKVMILAGIIFFVLVIVAGFNLMSAAGSEDPHAQEKWRLITFNALIGLLIIIGAYWFLQVINSVIPGRPLDSILGG